MEDEVTQFEHAILQHFGQVKISVPGLGNRVHFEQIKDAFKSCRFSKSKFCSFFPSAIVDFQSFCCENKFDFFAVRQKNLKKEQIISFYKFYNQGNNFVKLGQNFVF